MKIAYVTNYLPGYHAHVGGAERALWDTAALAKERGTAVFFMVTPFSRITRASPVPDNVYAVRTLESVFPFLEKAVQVLKWYVFQFDPVSYRISLRILRKERPDIVHAGNMQFLTFSVFAAARRLRIPVVFSVYDYWCFCPLTTLHDVDQKPCRTFHGAGCVRCTPRVFRFIQRILLLARKKIFGRFLKKVGRFIVLSESSAGILESYGIPPAAIRMIRLPLKERPAETVLQDGKVQYVLFMGWLQKRKGLHILLEAMRRVWEFFPAVKLYAVLQDVRWERPYEREIIRMVDRLPKDKIAVFKGQRSRQEIDAIIRGARIVVIPEQWENMSPVLLIEAMGMAKPVVASRIGGVPEFLDDLREGLLARHDDPEDFFYKISYLLTYRERAEEMGVNARAKIQALLEPGAIADQLDKEYRSWIPQSS